MPTILTVIMIGVLSVPILGQTPSTNDVTALSRQVVELYKQEKFKEALPAAKQVVALREAETHKNDLLIADALVNLGEVYRALNKPKEAEQVIERAVELYSAKDSVHPRLARTLETLAVVYYVRGDKRKTEEAFRRSIEVSEKRFGASHKQTLQTMNNVAVFYIGQHDFVKAETVLEQAVKLGDKGKEDDDSPFAVSLARYTCTLRKLDKTAEADAVLKKYEPSTEDVDKGGEIENAFVFGKGVVNGAAIEKFQPPYPAEAKQQRVSGTVNVQVMIDKNGNVIHSCAIEGPKLLREQAENAAYRWRFSPTLLDGNPARVTGTITFKFTLQ